MERIKFINSNECANILKRKGEKVLVIDARTFCEFNTSHIKNAINVWSSKIRKKRLQQNSLSVSDLIRQACRSVFRDMNFEDVIVYNQSCENFCALSEDSFLYVLLIKLANAFLNVFLLQGGFLDFQTKYNDLCECSTGKSALTTSLSQPCMPVMNHCPSKILPFLYLGSQTDSNDNHFLEAHNIRYQLNATTKCAKPIFLKDAHFLRIGVNDDFNAKLTPFFDDTFEFIEKAREFGSSVLVHCLAGVSRSPTIVIAYVMRHLGIHYDDAYRYVKKRRPCVSPNINFVGQLLELDSMLFGDSAMKFKSTRSCLYLEEFNRYSPTFRKTSEFSLGKGAGNKARFKLGSLSPDMENWLSDKENKFDEKFKNALFETTAQPKVDFESGSTDSRSLFKARNPDPTACFETKSRNTDSRADFYARNSDSRTGCESRDSKTGFETRNMDFRSDLGTRNIDYKTRFDSRYDSSAFFNKAKVGSGMEDRRSDVGSANYKYSSNEGLFRPSGISAENIGLFSDIRKDVPKKSAFDEIFEDPFFSGAKKFCRTGFEDRSTDRRNVDIDSTVFESRNLGSRMDARGAGLDANGRKSDNFSAMKSKFFDDTKFDIFDTKFKKSIFPTKIISSSPVADDSDDFSVLTSEIRDKMQKRRDNFNRFQKYSLPNYFQRNIELNSDRQRSFSSAVDYNNDFKCLSKSLKTSLTSKTNSDDLSRALKVSHLNEQIDKSLSSSSGDNISPVKRGDNLRDNFTAVKGGDILRDNFTTVKRGDNFTAVKEDLQKFERLKQPSNQFNFDFEDKLISEPIETRYGSRRIRNIPLNLEEDADLKKEETCYTKTKSDSTDSTNLNESVLENRFAAESNENIECSSILGSSASNNEENKNSEYKSISEKTSQLHLDEKNNSKSSETEVPLNMLGCDNIKPVPTECLKDSNISPFNFNSSGFKSTVSDKTNEKTSAPQESENSLQQSNSDVAIQNYCIKKQPFFKRSCRSFTNPEKLTLQARYNEKEFMFPNPDHAASKLTELEGPKLVDSKTGFNLTRAPTVRSIVELNPCYSGISKCDSWSTSGLGSEPSDLESICGENFSLDEARSAASSYSTIEQALTSESPDFFDKKMDSVSLYSPFETPQSWHKMLEKDDSGVEIAEDNFRRDKEEKSAPKNLKIETKNLSCDFGDSSSLRNFRYGNRSPRPVTLPGVLETYKGNYNPDSESQTEEKIKTFEQIDTQNTKKIESEDVEDQVKSKESPKQNVEQDKMENELWSGQFEKSFKTSNDFPPQNVANNLTDVENEDFRGLKLSPDLIDSVERAFLNEMWDIKKHAHSLTSRYNLPRCSATSEPWGLPYQWPKTTRSSATNTTTSEPWCLPYRCPMAKVENESVSEFFNDKESFSALNSDLRTNSETETGSFPDLNRKTDSVENYDFSELVINPSENQERDCRFLKNDDTAAISLLNLQNDNVSEILKTTDHDSKTELLAQNNHIYSTPSTCVANTAVSSAPSVSDFISTTSHGITPSQEQSFISRLNSHKTLNSVLNKTFSLPNVPAESENSVKMWKSLEIAQPKNRTCEIENDVLYNRNRCTYSSDKTKHVEVAKNRNNIANESIVKLDCGTEKNLDCSKSNGNVKNNFRGEEKLDWSKNNNDKVCGNGENLECSKNNNNIIRVISNNNNIRERANSEPIILKSNRFNTDNVVVKNEAISVPKIYRLQPSFGSLDKLDKLLANSKGGDIRLSNFPSEIDKLLTITKNERSSDNEKCDPFNYRTDKDELKSLGGELSTLMNNEIAEQSKLLKNEKGQNAVLSTRDSEIMSFFNWKFNDKSIDRCDSNLKDIAEKNTEKNRLENIENASFPIGNNYSSFEVHTDVSDFSFINKESNIDGDKQEFHYLSQQNINKINKFDPQNNYKNFNPIKEKRLYPFTAQAVENKQNIYEENKQNTFNKNSMEICFKPDTYSGLNKSRGNINFVDFTPSGFDASNRNTELNRNFLEDASNVNFGNKLHASTNAEFNAQRNDEFVRGPIINEKFARDSNGVKVNDILIEKIENVDLMSISESGSFGLNHALSDEDSTVSVQSSEIVDKAESSLRDVSHIARIAFGRQHSEIIESKSNIEYEYLKPKPRGASAEAVLGLSSCPSKEMEVEISDISNFFEDKLPNEQEFCPKKQPENEQSRRILNTDKVKSNRRPTPYLNLIRPESEIIAQASKRFSLSALDSLSRHRLDGNFLDIEKRYSHSNKQNFDSCPDVSKLKLISEIDRASNLFQTSSIHSFNSSNSSVNRALFVS